MQNKQTSLERLACLVTHFDTTQNPSVPHYKRGMSGDTSRLMLLLPHAHTHTHIHYGKRRDLTPQRTSWPQVAARQRQQTLVTVTSQRRRTTNPPTPRPPNLQLQLPVVSLKRSNLNRKDKSWFSALGLDKTTRDVDAWSQRLMFVFWCLVGGRSVYFHWHQSHHEHNANTKKKKNSDQIYPDGRVTRWCWWGEITAVAGSVWRHPQHKGLSSSWGWRQRDNTMCSYVRLAPAAAHQRERSSVPLRETTDQRGGK